MLVLIRGAGDIASGVAFRLYRSGIPCIMTDLLHPTCIRRKVAFSDAILHGRCEVEDITGVLVHTVPEAMQTISDGKVPVFADPWLTFMPEIMPDILVDAILAKKNLGTTIDMAKAVVGIGPGFTAGIDCHAVVETMRGHTLGRVYYSGSAIPNTNIPGLIGGYAGERVIRAPKDGIFTLVKDIGSLVAEGDIVGYVEGEPVRCTISGVLRGILPDGTEVFKGMKSGDVDPRSDVNACYTVSDKALAVGGGALEAVLHLAKRNGIQ